MIDWQQKEHAIALEGKHPQLRKFATEKMDVEICTTEHIRKWIYILKEIKKEQKSMKETIFEVILG